MTKMIEEAIKVGRELEKLNYYWFEHPMPEYRVDSYVRLCRELSIPILSPEIVAGGVFSRADWIIRGAGDMTRIDVMRGGITGARKTAIVAEAYGLRCEIHMAGWGNLQVMGATSEDTSEYYEKGLLALEEIVIKNMFILLACLSVPHISFQEYKNILTNNI